MFWLRIVSNSLWVNLIPLNSRLCPTINMAIKYDVSAHHERWPTLENKKLFDWSISFIGNIYELWYFHLNPKSIILLSRNPKVPSSRYTSIHFTHKCTSCSAICILLISNNSPHNGTGFCSITYIIYINLLHTYYYNYLQTLL